jgi:hypothetical protein
MASPGTSANSGWYTQWPPLGKEGKANPQGEKKLGCGCTLYLSKFKPPPLLLARESDRHSLSFLLGPLYAVLCRDMYFMLGIVVVLSHGCPCPCPCPLPARALALRSVLQGSGRSWRRRRCLAVGDLDHLASALALDAHAVVLARGDLCVDGLAVCW